MLTSKNPTEENQERSSRSAQLGAGETSQCLSLIRLPHSHPTTSDFALVIYRLSNSQSINIQILGTTTILMIANVTDEDYGNYTCVASNRLGVQNASLFLFSK